MTKAELVRRITRRSGVPDSEARIFFEIFLRYITKQIPQGDAVKVKGIGCFRLRKGKIRNQNIRTGIEFIFTDLVVYSPEAEDNDSIKDRLLFSVPVIEEEEFKSPDYHFSLSIGKPVIPLKGLKHSEFFMPPGGEELRQLLFSKAEKLFKESEIIRKTVEQKDILVIKPEQGAVFPGEVSGKVEDAPLVNPGKLSWSGDDINKELEQESLLDTGRPDITDEELDLREIVKRHAKDFLDEEPAKDVPEGTMPDKTTDTPAVNLNPNLEKDLVSDKFERVRSVNSGREKDKPAFNKQANTGDNTPHKNKVPDSNVPFKKDFPLAPSKPPVKRDYQLVKSIPLNEISKDKRGRTAIDDEPEKIHKDYSGRRSKAAMVVVFSILVFSVAAAVLFFTPGIDIFGGKDNKEIIKAAVVPVIIERSYDIPVTYPYDKTQLNETDFSFEPFAINTGKNISPDRAQNNVPEVKEGNNASGLNAENKSGTANQIPADVIPVKVKENIFRYNNDFIVQVSSWKSFNKAESEVERFNGSGYKAFMEEAYLSDKGRYYRVRVGNFATLQEAEDFLKKNI